MINQCKKCGFNQVDVKYIANDELITYSSFDKIDNEFVYSNPCGLHYTITAKKEHLLVTCKQCGYKERKNVIDKDGK